MVQSLDTVDQHDTAKPNWIIRFSVRMLDTHRFTGFAGDRCCATRARSPLLAWPSWLNARGGFLGLLVEAKGGAGAGS
jgi:hypothetical protein